MRVNFTDDSAYEPEPTNENISDIAFHCEQRVHTVLCLVKRLAHDGSDTDIDRCFEGLAELIEPIARDLSLLSTICHIRNMEGDDIGN